MVMGGGGQKDVSKFPTCVLQDIGPLGPLPKKHDGSDVEEDETRG